MKSTVIVVLSVLCASATRARGAEDATAPTAELFAHFDALERTATQRQAARRLNTGKSLTAVSLVHLTIASAMWWAIAGSWVSCHGTCRNDSLVATLPPAGLYSFTGALFLSIGVPLWVRGARQHREILRAERDGAALVF